MTATAPIARDDIHEMFTTIWAPTGHPVHNPGVADKLFPPKTQIPWARLNIAHAAGGQTAFGDGGQRRYTHTGIFTVQIFTKLGDGGKEAYALAQTVVQGLQGAATPNAVWFKNVRINEVGPSRDWYQLNVLSDFEYDQLTTAAAEQGTGGAGQPLTLNPIT